MLIYSCKKQIKLPPPPTQHYKILTSHYWRLQHHWWDSSQTGIVNPLLLPLVNTQDSYAATDSCAYFTGEKFSTDGNIYTVKGKHCGYITNTPFLSNYPQSSIDGTISWRFNDNVTPGEIYYGKYSYKILTLNDSVFSYYNTSTYGTGGNYYKMINVRVYKSYTDW